MKDLFNKALSVTCLTICGAVSHAEDVSTHSAIVGGETLPRLIHAALAKSPELEALRGELEAVKAKQSDLSWWDVPEVRMGYGRDARVSSDFQSDQDPNHEYDAALRIFPRNPWERKAAGLKLQSEYGLGQKSLGLNEQLIVLNVKDLYSDYNYHVAELAVQKQVAAIYESQSKAMEALLESGQASISQSLPVQMKVLDATFDLNDSERSVAMALNELVRMTGLDKRFIRANTLKPLDESAFNFPYSEWESIALNARIELAEIDHAMDYTQAELKHLRAENMPWIKHLQANYEVRNDYGDRDSAGVQIAISLPFFASDNGAKQAAMLTLKSQQQQRTQKTNIVRAEVRALIDQFESLKAEWSQLNTTVLPLMKSLGESIKAMEAQNAQSNRNYWDAQIAMLELSKKTLKLLHEYQKLLNQAERVLGRDLSV